MSFVNSFDDSGNDSLGVTPPERSSDSNNRSPPRILSEFVRSPVVEDPGMKRSRNQKQNPGTPQTPPAKRESRSNTAETPDMVVLVTRTDMYDAGKNSDDGEANVPTILGYPNPPVAEYCHDAGIVMDCADEAAVTVCRVRSSLSITQPFWMELNVHDKSVPNPFDRSVHKYWNQRRRLFSRFEEGIQLDEEGWFSVTPEQIANHVADRTVAFSRSYQSASTNDLIILDSFCGCGGNSIAFARQPEVTLVVCVDIDRSKLLRAANNASIYDIPVSKIVFIECNVLFLLEHCYKNGIFVLDQPIDTPEKADAMIAAMPPPVPSETTIHGYRVGGIDMLPPRIGAVFMDPPWGGVDYAVFGKNGYCLERNMRIPRPTNQIATVLHASEGMPDGFFDSFCASPQPRNKEERKAAFNSGRDEDNYANGADLLRLAAAAALNAHVIYDVPRNTNRISLGRAAIRAGYRGNCKLEEHYLNSRLKTVTAYFGSDWRDELLPKDQME